MKVQVNTLLGYGDIKDYYYVDAEGNIYGKDGKVLKSGITRGGYLKNNFSLKQGGYTTKAVHRIVALAFVPGYFEGATVNHIDECKANNKVENLEWLTFKDNHDYGTRNKRVGTANTNGICSKPVKQIDMLTGETIAVWQSAHEVERQLGFDQGSISKCCLGKLKSAYKYNWQYA